MGLEALPLHDALVERITLLWEEKTAEFMLLVFVTPGEAASRHRLQFVGVNNFLCPHVAPWGDSLYINSATGFSGSFSIEMQSGDEIKIEAAGFELMPADS